MLKNLLCNSCPRDLLLILLLMAWPGPGAANFVAAQEVDHFEQREFVPRLGDKWIGQGISYGPFRAGQSPHGALPTNAQLTEDLELIAQHWSLIRMYGASKVTGDVLKIIHEKKLPIRVMVGAWIKSERQSDHISADAAQDGRLANQSETAAAIRLANAFPDEVIAISIGNETQVFWSGHRTHPEVLIHYIRKARSATSVPVTTADDFNFWNKPESQAVANEIDFVVTHMHAMWLGQQLETAMPWTQETYRQICKLHPKKLVVIGEAGWATQVHNVGEQAKLIKGKAGEQEQKQYYEQFTSWANQNKIAAIYFEAFDEPWKGGTHPNEVEKHWGLFNENRTPKLAMREQLAKP